MRVARLRHVHSDPLFAYSRTRPIPLSNREAMDALLRGEVDAAFVPLVDAAENCDKVVVVEGVAIYSVGESLSARVFRGLGNGGWVAVRETRLSKLVVERLMGVGLSYVDSVDQAMASSSGVLVVGDDALRLVARGVNHLVDVGELWLNKVGTPLVFAVLAIRRGVDIGEARRLVEDLQSSVAMFFDYGIHVVDEAARRVGVPRSVIELYYTRIRWLTPRNYREVIDRELEVLGLPRCVEVV